MRRFALALGIAVALLASNARPEAQAPRFEYRIVYAATPRLEQALNLAALDGFGCVAVSRVEPGAGAPGLAVILSRPLGRAAAPVAHRVITGGPNGASLQAPLDASGADGFRVCGASLDEGPPRPSVVAVMARDAGAADRWSYGVEVLTDYRASLRRLGDAAKAGGLPVAAAAIDNNRLPDLRTWLLVVERPLGGRGAAEIAVRSSSTPSGLAKSLNEQGKLGFQVTLTWKDGNDVVAMMTHASGGPATTFSYGADRVRPQDFHFLPKLYLGDYPYLDGDRFVITDQGVPASADIEQDLLPPFAPTGVAPPAAMEVLGNHLTRHGGFAPATAEIRRAGPNQFRLVTVITERQ